MSGTPRSTSQVYFTLQPEFTEGFVDTPRACVIFTTDHSNYIRRYHSKSDDPHK